jgi:phosphoadenosine phosphosulfate reductase
VSSLANRLLPERTPLSDEFPSAEALDRALRDAPPQEIIAAALRAVGRDRLAVVSSFGTESAALLKVMADVDPAGCSRRRLFIAIR